MSRPLPAPTGSRLRNSWRSLGRSMPGVAGPLTLRQRLILSIVALVVLPVVVYQLRAEQRHQLRRTRR